MNTDSTSIFKLVGEGFTMNTDSTSIFKLVDGGFTVLLIITVDHNLYIIAKSVKLTQVSHIMR